MTLASSVKPRALGLAKYRGEFPIFKDRIYLNTARWARWASALAAK